MTNDRDQERVSAAYRDIAKESPPPALDRRILAAANRESRSQYGATRAWIRPVAWAATIALSLAILLEVTLFTDAPPPPGTQPASGTQPVERTRRDADVMRAKEADIVWQSAPQQAPAAALSESEEVAVPEPCDREARMTAESWYACIEALRDQQRDEHARTELDALRKAFPDFEVPSAE